MRKEISKTINNINFTVTQLGFDDGMELLTTLGSIIGPTLKESDGGIKALGDILTKIDAAKLKGIIYKLAKSTRIEREPNKWPILEPEVDLAGDYDLTFKWLFFALGANFSDFLGEEGFLSGIIEQEKAIVPKG